MRPRGQETVACGPNPGHHVLVNKAVLQWSHAHPLCNISGCFHALIPKPSSCNWVRLANKAKNVYYLPLYRKSLLMPSLDFKIDFWKNIVHGCFGFIPWTFAFICSRGHILDFTSLHRQKSPSLQLYPGALVLKVWPWDQQQNIIFGLLWNADSQISC